MIEPWRIQLLGGLRVRRGDQVILRFRTQKTGALLAYMAFHSTQPQMREVLTNVLWPDAEIEAARHNLRQSLSSLRHQLEPPGVSPGAVIEANRITARLNPNAVMTDVAEFEEAARRAFQADTDTQTTQLCRAADLYTGPLLPGFYESWIVPQMLRLQEEYSEVVTRLIAQFQAQGEPERAIHHAMQAIAFDPLQEEMQGTLMRLYADAKRPQDALRVYRTYSERIEQEWGQPPPEAMQELAQRLQQEPARRSRSQPQSASPLGRSVSVAPASPGPPPLSPEALDTGLPLSLSRFFGREEEIARLTSLLTPVPENPVRLVTLTGVGGTGKTRLAAEAGRRLTATFDNRLAFVSLENVAEASRIPEAIAGALRLTRSPHQDVLEQILQCVAGRPFLLLLDNFEQLVETGGGTLKTLLSHAPHLTCLVTSRQLLHIEGEQEFPVHPLPVPETEAGLETLLSYASVRLFVDRAQAALPDFQLTPHNARAISELCKRLDGIPLAIEMAAAWIRTLTPAQMLAQMARRFELLVSRRRDSSARHHSLRTTLEWSYQRLAPAVQRFFTRLSLFRGGWTLEAAEVVCAEPQALLFLTELHECYLVLAEDTGTEMRYRMLETMREYAADQLSPVERTEVENRFARYFLEEARATDTRLTGPDQPQWLAYLNRENDNLWNALEICHRLPETGMELASNLWRFWRITGRWKEGLDYLQAMLHHPQNAVPSLIRARALCSAGILARAHNLYPQARAFYEDSLAIYKQQGDEYRMAGILNNLATLYKDTAEYDSAHRVLEQALQINRKLGNRNSIAYNLLNLGMINHAIGHFETSAQYYEEALAIRRAGEDLFTLATVLNNYGYMLLHAGHLDEASLLCAESVLLHQQIGAHHTASQGNLGYIAMQRQQYEQAFSLYCEDLTNCRKLKYLLGIAITLRWTGYLAEKEGHRERAVCLLAAADVLSESCPSALLPCEQTEHFHSLERLKTALGQEKMMRYWERGRLWTWEQAVECAICSRVATEPG